jgi:DNA-binding transcriptional ArsR family regulator
MVKKNAPAPANFELDLNQVHKARFHLRALDNEARASILQLIHLHGEMIVTDIYTTLDIEQAEASQQLAILRRAGFLVTRRERRNIYYSLNYSRIQTVIYSCTEINTF